MDIERDLLFLPLAQSKTLSYLCSVKPSGRGEKSSECCSVNTANICKPSYHPTTGMRVFNNHYSFMHGNTIGTVLKTCHNAVEYGLSNQRVCDSRKPKSGLAPQILAKQTKSCDSIVCAPHTAAPLCRCLRTPWAKVEFILHFAFRVSYLSDPPLSDVQT